MVDNEEEAETLKVLVDFDRECSALSRVTFEPSIEIDQRDTCRSHLSPVVALPKASKLLL